MIGWSSPFTEMVHGFLELLNINYAAVDTPAGLCHCGYYIDEGIGETVFEQS
jgi:hypothetical protein